jgi:hypothetical protein
VERCPVAHRGVGSGLLAACPGYEAEVVRIGHGPGAGLELSTCRHLAGGGTSRGFAAHCHHPDAAAVVPAARRAAAGIPRPPPAPGR